MAELEDAYSNSYSNPSTSSCSQDDLPNLVSSSSSSSGDDLPALVSQTPTKFRPVFAGRGADVRAGSSHGHPARFSPTTRRRGRVSASKGTGRYWYWR